MYAFLLSVAVAAAPPGDTPKPTHESLDGNWTVLCAEKDGQPMTESKDMTVTIKGDTITCNGKDGKKHMTMHVEFGPKGTIKVADTTSATAGSTPEAKAGVYVHTHDFLAVCVHKTGDRPTPATPPAAPGATPGAAPTSKPDAKYSYVIFLKREGAK